MIISQTLYGDFMIKCFHTTSIVAMFMLAAVQACSLSTHQEDIKGSTKTEQVMCNQPRPEVCTMNYLPVCALLENGGYKTYSNGCNACSDLTVIRYRNGACDQTISLGEMDEEE